MKLLRFQPYFLPDVRDYPLTSLPVHPSVCKYLNDGQQQDVLFFFPQKKIKLNGPAATTHYVQQKYPIIQSLLKRTLQQFIKASFVVRCVFRIVKARNHPTKRPTGIYTCMLTCAQYSLQITVTVSATTTSSKCNELARVANENGNTAACVSIYKKRGTQAREKRQRRTNCA